MGVGFQPHVQSPNDVHDLSGFVENCRGYELRMHEFLGICDQVGNPVPWNRETRRTVEEEKFSVS